MVAPKCGCEDCAASPEDVMPTYTRNFQLKCLGWALRKMPQENRDKLVEKINKRLSPDEVEIVFTAMKERIET